MTEHEAFAKLTEALREAAEAAARIGALRADNRWDQIAGALTATRDAAFELAMRNTIQ